MNDDCLAGETHKYSNWKMHRSYNYSENLYEGLLSPWEDQRAKRKRES